MIYIHNQVLFEQKKEKKRVLNAFSKYYKSIHRRYFFVSSLLTSTTVASQVSLLSPKCSSKWCLLSHVLLGESFFVVVSRSRLRLVSALFAEAGGGVVE